MSEKSQLHDQAKTPFVPVCAIGASAGGVTALQNLFRLLPNDLGLAYVVILHLSPDQPSALGEILANCTRMPVLQVQDGPLLQRNSVYVIPPDRELVIEGDNITARPFDMPRGRRAPIDMFFRSIATGRGDGIAVVLSGAGADGAQGVRAVKAAGGVIMVQEPAEASFASMPQSAVATGVADFVAPLARLAELLAEVARSKEAVRSLDMDGSANDLRRIVAFLRARTGHDFSSYKRATITRRVMRRMQVCRTDTLAAYADHLLTTPDEAKELFSDLLISVTMFFRDPHAFDALERLAVRSLVDAFIPIRDEAIRAWVIGCATGEEAYSLAILLHEAAARRQIFPQVQIFATDLDESALAVAREGRYPRTIEADVSEDRLARFFTDEGTHYCVRKELRDSIVFAAHSVVKDPPFVRLDLITCRNLLIYMERTMQQQLAAVFHHSLKPAGFLFLGSAETADAGADLFTPLDRDARIYGARPHGHYALPILPQFVGSLPTADTSHVTAPRSDRPVQPAAVHAAALERIAPASVLVDSRHTVVHLSPNAGRFMLLTAGPIATVLPALVRPELRAELRLALTCAFDRKEPTLTHPIVVAFDAEKRRVSMHVAPVPTSGNAGAQALVFFLDTGAAPAAEPDSELDARSDEVRRLHAELRYAQEAVDVSRNGHDAAIQDLRATNEELQSINEEYRSTAEELETSKEELQSINEELHTVNAELKSKLASISIAHSDLKNLTGSTEIGTLFLDGELRIRMFTPPVVELFNVAEADVGRAVTDFTHRLEYDALADDARLVLRDLIPVETEVRSRDGHWFVVRLRPYRTIDNRIDGVVVTFVDTTARRNAEMALRESEERHRITLQLVPVLLWRAEPSGEAISLYTQWLAYTGQLEADTQGFGWLDALHPDDLPGARADFERSFVTGNPLQRQLRIRHTSGSFRWFLVRHVPVRDDDGAITYWFGAAVDVDDLQRLQERLQVLVAELQHRTRNLLTVVRNIARRSIEFSPGRDQYDARLAALGRVQGFLSRSPLYTVPLAELVAAELAAIGSGILEQATVGGPDVELPGESVQVVALALHELATNAVKYGAFAHPSGRLSVSWHFENANPADPRLVIDWRESGVVLAAPPERRGFGSELITRALPYQLRAETSLEFGTDGVRCRISMPLSVLTPEPSTTDGGRTKNLATAL